MNEATHLLHEIDRYLNGEMDGQEQDAFEQLRLQDADFSAKVEEQIEFRRILRSYGDRKELIGKLSRIHSALNTPNQVQEAESKTSPVIQSTRMIWASMAAAAAIALLIVGATLWFSNYIRPDNNSTRYRELKRDMDYIKRSQNAIINDMRTSKAPVNPGKFGGTGFALTTDGYLATNYHVIENADSIYVQDNKGNEFKAKMIFQDPSSDLAILKIIDSTFQLPPLPYTLMNKSADLGEEVFTLGYPKDDIVYGKGYISAETGFRDDTSSYQVAINVNQGNSGSPLLDNRGNIVGIVSGKQTLSNDIAFAVKSACLNDILDSLNTDSVKIGFLNKPSPLSHMSRTDQIKKLENYIFVVKVYN